MIWKPVPQRGAGFSLWCTLGARNSRHVGIGR